jgi:drug/metabolite transporter superfamily protein YnfA
MDEIYFLTRYIPFWAVPLLLIGGEFAYLFWVRKKKKWVTLCTMLAIISFCSLIYYWWAGGPEKSVQFLMKIVRFYTN